MLKLPKTFAIFFITALGFLLFTRTSLADVTPPTTTYVQTPSSPDGNNGWYKTPVRFDLTATDLESGVKEIWYRVDSGTWQTYSFSDALNLAQNPSFEEPAASDTGISKWDNTVADSAGIYSQDLTNYFPGYAAASARIEAPGGVWHGINNKDYFAVATPYENMSASVWVKTQDVTSPAYFNIYALSYDVNGHDVETLLAQSNSITGTNDWTKLSANFVVSVADAVGVYVDIGFGSSGTIWIDAATINSGASSATTSVTIGSDSANHRLEFYAVDNSNNTETYSCTTPKKNCIDFKLDQTTPGNWHDSGAFRGLFGSSHELYVYTTVEDETSGLSTFTDKYQYYTENNPDFGRYSNLLGCNSQWQSNGWATLFTPPFNPGVESAYLITQKTDFCNSNWKICKIVRFYSEDMAGNYATKDFCINGPWIKTSGKAAVRANNDISMIAESNTDNTDGLIEIQGTSIDFFTSSKNWKAKSIDPPTTYNYDVLNALVTNKTTITDGKLRASSGKYLVDGNFTITNQAIPSGYSSNTFDQIVFINGDLVISTDTQVANTSTALFVVKGKVEIAKTVNTIKVAILADGDFYTAYDVNEGESNSTLTLNGIYAANKFIFQRTLQGTNNNNSPSEIFNYEPKYAIKQATFFGNYKITWESIE